MRYIFLILFSINNLVTNAQCNEIQIGIRSQADVDQFITESMGCDSIKYLSILANSPIYNLDSLYKLKYVNELQLDNYGPGMDTKGLRNLEGVNYLWIHVYKGMDTLNSLKEVNRLDAIYPTNDTTLDLSIFSKLNFIQNLWLKGSLKWEGLQKFNSNDEFVLTIQESKIKNNISNLLPENLNRIRGLRIRDSENVIIDKLKTIKEVSFLQLYRDERINFQKFNDIKHLDQIEFLDVIGNDGIVFGEAFYNVDTLDFLSTGFNKHDINYYDLLPNLKNVKGRLQIRHNTGSVNLGFFRNFSKLNGQGSVVVKNRYLDIYNNSNISGCANRFICQNLINHQDSSLVADNTDGCNLEEILEYCITSTDELEEESTTIYPNPTSGMIYLMGSRIERVEVIDPIGRLVFNGASTTIDLTNQPYGLYLLRIHKKDGTMQTEKVIKI